VERKKSQFKRIFRKNKVKKKQKKPSKKGKIRPICINKCLVFALKKFEKLEENLKINLKETLD